MGNKLQHSAEEAAGSDINALTEEPGAEGQQAASSGLDDKTGGQQVLRVPPHLS